jgi:putative PIN family toxin of toxin-antitoxin system
LLDIAGNIIYDIMTVVVDTNVVLRAFRSKNGASHRVLRSLLLGEFECLASPAVILEYEDVLKRPGILGPQPAFTENEIDAVLDAICARVTPVLPWFRFRPFLDDPKDDLFIDCALSGGASIVVTDDRHFRHPAVRAFGLTAITAADFVSYQRSPR